MANTGSSNVEITASSKKAESTFTRFFKTVEGQGRRFKKSMDGLSPFEKMERDGVRIDKTIGRSLKNLPDHLKPFHSALNETRREFRDLDRQAGKSLDEIADSALKTGVALKDMTSVTSSGKQAIKIIDDISDSVKETQLAVMGLNKEGKLRISSEESEAQMRKFRIEIEKAKESLEEVRDAGDFASYEAGMEVLERKMYDVDRAFVAVSRGGTQYNRMLRELGIVTSATANQSAIAMEAYKDRFIRSVDLMNARATQSSKMMKILPEVSSIVPIDRMFLKIGDSIETMAKRGTAANLALEMLGPRASMKDLSDRIRLINQGLMRMQQVSIALGIAFAAFTAVMFGAAKGPSPADVLAKQAEALANYSEAVQKRTNEIASAWTLFENIQLEKTSGAKLTKNLQEQVKELDMWRQHLSEIGQRAGTEFANYLSQMGPQSAGEVRQIAHMTGPELDKYVALWKEKMSLARKQAETELEGLKRATDQKVKELQDSLTPLGIAIENFQRTWAEAAGPFVKSWGDMAAKVVDAATAIGDLVNKLNQLNPGLSAAAGNFLYLATAIGLMLSPMAIGIGRANGMRAAFTFIVTTLRPLILGFLRIAGMASVVSGAIVIIVGIFMKMWGASEKLRTAVGDLFDVLKSLASTVAAPLIDAFKQISKEFVALINNMVGSKGSNMQSFWKTTGDIVASAVTKITAVIKALQPVFSVVFKIIGSLVVSTFHNIVNVVTSGIAIIQNIFLLFKNLATGNFSAAWGNIKAIFKNALIFIWNYVQLMFVGKMLGAFKGFASSGLALLKAGWTGIRTAAVTIFTAIRDFILKMFTGINSGATKISSGFINGLSKLWSIFWNTTKSIFTTIYNFFKTIFSSIHQFITGRVELTWKIVRGTWNLFLKTTMEIFRALGKGIASIFSSLWKTVTTAAGNIKNGLVNAFNSTLKSAKSIFESLYKSVSGTFSKMVSSAKALPKRIGDGIKGMASYAVAGAADMSKKVGNALVDGINKVTGGVNWVLEKIKVKTRLPKMDRYAKGTDFHPGGPAIVGEEGRELAHIPGIGTTIVGMQGSELLNLPRGSSVLPNKETEDLLSKFYPGYASGIGNFFKGLLNKSIDIWDYISEPKKLLDKVIGKLNIPSMNMGGFLGGIATKGFSTVKDKAGDYIKNKLDDFGAWSGAVPNITGGITSWKPIIIAAAKRMGEVLSSREINGILAQIKRESGGNQRITQSSAVVDVNTLSGNPARGLLQYIPQTFRAYAVKGANNIYSGYDQLLAFFNNKNWRRDLPYGTRGWSPRGARKFAKGGFFLNGPEMGLFGEGGPEMALPLIGKNMQPYSEAVAQNLANITGGNFGSSQEVHNHYWNVNADEINEVQKLVNMVNGLRQGVRKM